MSASRKELPDPMKRAVARLRRLACWYEWGDNLAAADALQAAADAVQEGSLGLQSAHALIAVWRPMAGIEAHAGKRPKNFVVAETEDDLQGHVIADMRRMIARTTNSAKRLHLTKLLEDQIQTFAEKGRHAAA